MSIREHEPRAGEPTRLVEISANHRTVTYRLLPGVTLEQARTLPDPVYPPFEIINSQDSTDIVYDAVPFAEGAVGPGEHAGAIASELNEPLLVDITDGRFFSAKPKSNL